MISPLVDSPEYKTLILCYPVLVYILHHSSKDVGIELYKHKNVLTLEDLRYTRNRMNDEVDKIQRLLDAVLTNLQKEPRVYDTFIKALKGAGSFTRTAVSTLEDTYAAIKSSTAELCFSIIPGRVALLNAYLTCLQNTLF